MQTRQCRHRRPERVRRDLEVEAVYRLAHHGTGLLQRAHQTSGVSRRKSAAVLDMLLPKPPWRGFAGACSSQSSW